MVLILLVALATRSLSTTADSVVVCFPSANGPQSLKLLDVYLSTLFFPGVLGPIQGRRAKLIGSSSALKAVTLRSMTAVFVGVRAVLALLALVMGVVLLALFVGGGVVVEGVGGMVVGREWVARVFLDTVVSLIIVVATYVCVAITVDSLRRCVCWGCVRCQVMVVCVCKMVRVPAILVLVRYVDGVGLICVVDSAVAA